MVRLETLKKLTANEMVIGAMNLTLFECMEVEDEALYFQFEGRLQYPIAEGLYKNKILMGILTLKYTESEGYYLTADYEDEKLDRDEFYRRHRIDEKVALTHKDVCELLEEMVKKDIITLKEIAKSELL